MLFLLFFCRAVETRFLLLCDCGQLSADWSGSPGGRVPTSRSGSLVLNSLFWLFLLPEGSGRELWRKTRTSFIKILISCSARGPEIVSVLHVTLAAAARRP